MTRDHWDVSRCDAVLVVLSGATRVSIGTVMELGWAYAYRKPVVAVMEEEGNPHEHGMVREALSYRVTTLDEAIDLLNILKEA
jgi:nucleoside 2-deoxyribosyltransferase